MCAGSKTKLRDKEVDFYMGYYGCCLTIGGISISQDRDDNLDDQKDKMFNLLKSHKKEELVNLIMDLVYNGEE